ncbi:MAG: hypothetical protein BroJett011_42160 [Chloroflexota bacterium]|nr:MAG: hypothetical protein BroJett011_42160 [Chloroflexota bacterium]
MDAIRNILMGVVAEPSQGSTSFLAGVLEHAHQFWSLYEVFVPVMAAPTVPHIHYLNTLGDQGASLQDVTGQPYAGQFQIVLTNPPFSADIDKGQLSEDLRKIGNAKSELLVLERVLQLLAIGGRSAIIVPEGVLFSSSKAHPRLRQKLLKENRLEAIISLSAGTFESYGGGVKVSIMVFSRGGLPSDDIWFYETESVEQDWPDLLLKYHLRVLNDRQPDFVDQATWEQWQSWGPEVRAHRYAHALTTADIETQELATAAIKDWTVSVTQMDEGYNLTAKRYKPWVPIEYSGPSPLEIMRELIEMEAELTHHTIELAAMLGHLYDSPLTGELENMEKARTAQLANLVDTINQLHIPSERNLPSRLQKSS